MGGQAEEKKPLKHICAGLLAHVCAADAHRIPRLVSGPHGAGGRHPPRHGRRGRPLLGDDAGTEGIQRP